MSHRTEPPQRIAQLVLVTPDGGVVGSLPGVPVELPWWQEVESVVRAIRERHGIDVIVLRLLQASRKRPHGGDVVYLAEVAEPVAANHWAGRLEPHALRQTYAEPGGPAADLDWAISVIRRRGIRPSGAPVQIRSWNLSSIWRIPVHGETLWLKVVPPFFAHEPRLLTALAGEPVPRLLGHDGGRMLLAEIRGDDLYEATLPRLLEMVTLLVGIQASWAGRVEELQALGLPDWRGPALAAGIADVVGRRRAELSLHDAAVLDRFVNDLPRRFAGIEACGLPDTLVHGDFHPGNFRGTADRLTLLDWGDSGIGHPMLDQSAFLGRVPPAHRDVVQAHWVRRWQVASPGSDPARASQLLAPLAAARQAVVYQRFLDNIEPSEHVYHRHDPADWLHRMLALLLAEG
ncbi:phosphotransferase [Mesorhizobium sp. BAC0120]|uniref:phosphotransferase family protein n=1 Tax=Mesorhizobium sp. BAC0120 TaxID=3090670 RepID=UPI00298C637A|nr:phosphotransferase [Mesorhizobium sp. BAC0120]MDW6021452.1 phosphotransferase [Mesorhizobium sp. BAC0120]